MLSMKIWFFQISFRVALLFLKELKQRLYKIRLQVLQLAPEMVKFRG